MADKIDKEGVRPLTTARRPRFNARQVDAAGMERHQQLVQRARLVAHGDNDRGLVVAGRRHFLAADDQEARGVVRAILDFLRQLGQAIQAGRHITGDGRRIPLTFHPLRRIGIAGYGHALDVRVVGVQPLAALGQGLGVRVDTGDFVGLGSLANQQVVVNTQLHLTADHHVVLKEAVEGVIDRAFGGVFHRHHAKIHRTGRHFAEHFVDGRHRHADHRVAEMLHRRRLGERPFRAEVSHFQRLLKSQAGRHDLAEQTRHFLVVQRALIELHDVLEHPGLTFRTIEHRLFPGRQREHLHPRHFLGAAGALADQLEDFLVEAVNAHPQRLELIEIRHQPCSFSNSAM